MSITLSFATGYAMFVDSH